MMTTTRKDLGGDAQGHTSGHLGGEDGGDPVAIPSEHAAALGDVPQQQQRQHPR
jgi:hypothetical protein